MNTYTAFEYLMINTANAFDKDKILFEDRIEWVDTNFAELMEQAQTAEDPAKAIKAVQLLYKAADTGQTDAIVYLDAACSGIQLMSALLNCPQGAYNTGLINPNLRADLYTTGQEVMNNLLQGKTVLKISRSDLKQAIMTSGYGSQKEPRELFEPLGVLNEFYQAMNLCAPEAFRLMQLLLQSWNGQSNVHAWVLPDGFQAIIPVTEKLEKRVEIAELGGASVTVAYEDYAIKDKGLSNVANAIHSVDSFVLRNMLRRCSYNTKKVTAACSLILQCQDSEVESPAADSEIAHMIMLAQVHQFIDPVWFNLINETTVLQIPKWILQRLSKLGRSMLEHASFEVTTVHDAFGSHASNCNRVRYWYKEILAELAESRIINAIWNQLGKPGSITRNPCIADQIRNSNYALG